MSYFWLVVLAFQCGWIGWALRGHIADQEHEYRWWVEGCRHNIEERWRGAAEARSEGVSGIGVRNTGVVEVGMSTPKERLGRECGVCRTLGICDHGVNERTKEGPIVTMPNDPGRSASGEDHTCVECREWVSYSARPDLCIHFGCVDDWKRKNSVLPDGTWSCVRDHRTTLCGDCDGCRYIQSLNKIGVSHV